MNIVRNFTKRTSGLASTCLEHFRAGQNLPATSRFVIPVFRKNYSSSEVPKVQQHEVIESQQQTALSDTLKKINAELATNSEGRLFAQVHVCGKQFKVTAEDLIVLEGHWPPDAGERIKLEKVMLVGGRDFTIVGKPVLPKDLVSVEATVVEKSLAHTRTVFKTMPRKMYKRIHFHRQPLTMLRINSIKINEQLVLSKASD